MPKSWTLGPQGGFFAFVKHPFLEGMSTEELSRKLAIEYGVITLPASFFSDPAKTGGHDGGPWMRISVANVGNDYIEQVCRRLLEFELANKPAGH